MFLTRSGSQKQSASSKAVLPTYKHERLSEGENLMSSSAETRSFSKDLSVASCEDLTHTYLQDKLLITLYHGGALLCNRLIVKFVTVEIYCLTASNYKYCS